MPAPISEAFASTLRSDPTAALGALMVIAGAHRELYVWANHAICGATLQPEPPAKPHGGNGAGHARKPRGGGAHLTKRDRDDEALVEAMRKNPEGPINAWAGVIHKSKGSVATALRRLKDAGLVENEGRKWRLAEETAPREPPPRWTKPLSGAERAHQVHLTA